MGSDDEPGEGEYVEDGIGGIWYRSFDDEGGGWFRYIEELGDFGGDPESWAKVTGSYGPAKWLPDYNRQ